VERLNATTSFCMLRGSALPSRFRMLTTIGRKPVTEDLVQLLLECHTRIRFFVQLAARLGASEGLSDDDIKDSAQRVASYFEQALPLHARDEEDSLLPRLRGLDAELDDELAEMCEEHEEHEPAVAELIALCLALRDEPTRHAELKQALSEVAGELGEHFERHLQREERVIFPALAARLDAATQAAIVAELRARRTPPAS
jgi:iron-sulfur cluster repair protein YtfE (RIC family)